MLVITSGFVLVRPLSAGAPCTADVHAARSGVENRAALQRDAPSPSRTHEIPPLSPIPVRGNDVVHHFRRQVDA
jgi:hypothetical protein